MLAAGTQAATACHHMRNSLRCTAVAFVVGLASVVAMPTAALAGGYLGLALSSEGDIGKNAQTGGTIGTRKAISVGQRWRMLSAEVNLSGFDARLFYQEYSGFALGAAARLSVPVFPLLHVFGQGGVEYTDLNAKKDTVPDLSGTQLVLGAGAELKVSLLASGSVYAGYFVRTGELSYSDRATKFAADHGQFALGVTLGF